MQADGAFEYIGLKPTAEAFKGLGILNDYGYIETDSFMATKVPGIFGAGDIISKHLRQVKLEQLISENKKVLADFYSKTCGPCKMLGFVLMDVAKNVDDVEIVKLDFDENKETLEKHGVTGYPTMIVFNNGQEVQRTQGLQQKPVILMLIREALRNWQGEVNL